MELSIIFLKSKNIFAEKDRVDIESIVRKAAESASAQLKIKGIVSIVIYPYNLSVDGQPWVSAATQFPECLWLTVPLKGYIKEDLAGAVHHEMHHIPRKHFLCSGRENLMECVFNEGLAIRFEMENVPGRIPKYAVYGPSILKFLPLFMEQRYRRSFNREEWFQQKGRERWIGYKLGMFFMDKIKVKNPNLTSADLLKMSSYKLLALSGVESVKF